MWGAVCGQQCVGCVGGQGLQVWLASMVQAQAGRPVTDYADNWCSLFELFVSVSLLLLGWA